MKRKAKKNTSLINSISVNGTLITNGSDIARNLNEYFASVPHDIIKDVPSVERPRADAQEIIRETSPEIIPGNFDLVNNPVDVCEMFKAVNELKPKTSTDLNGISMSFLKDILINIQVPLCYLINRSFATGTFPEQFKTAKIVPIFKGGDKINLDNYRPISLLDNFSKIYEKIMHNRLSTFLEAKDLISEYQFGFRKSHSTIHPIILAQNFISEALNNKQHVIGIFCDLRKAFDCVDHKILLNKLTKLGISGSELKWFSSYLENRSQFVSLGDIKSKILTTNIGVPQGSILGPLLFLVYINDLPDCSVLKAFLFADDTNLLAAGPNIAELYERVQFEFNKVCQFFFKNKLVIHPTKTKFIVFTTCPSAKNLRVINN